jgi:hypothetical protein
MSEDDGRIILLTTSRVCRQVSRRYTHHPSERADWVEEAIGVAILEIVDGLQAKPADTLNSRQIAVLAKRAADRCFRQLSRNRICQPHHPED